jgi:23S rRNA (guanosine2251-2'-O)-methyltransferase
MKRRYSKSLGRRTHANPDSPISTLGEEESLDQLTSLEHQPFVLVLDQVQDPRNLGACLRSADGAGVDLVVLPNDRAAGLTETVRHVACGAVENLRIARVVNLARYLEKLSLAGIRLIGTSDQAKKSVFEAELSGPCALIMGAEETGIRRLTAKHCDELIYIPMSGKVECLNVSVATGICLFEARRQRSLSVN